MLFKTEVWDFSVYCAGQQFRIYPRPAGFVCIRYHHLQLFPDSVWEAASSTLIFSASFFLQSVSDFFLLHSIVHLISFCPFFADCPEKYLRVYQQSSPLKSGAQVHGNTSKTCHSSDLMLLYPRTVFILSILTGDMILWRRFNSIE